MSKRKHSFHNFPQKRQMAQIRDETEAQKRSSHEARIVPGLGGLQWGFPKSIITTHRYCDVYQLTSTLGSVGKQVFAANGTNDPDITGIGHQPMWRDVYAGIYNNYTVLGSKITVHFTANETDQSWIVGIIADDTGTTSTTLSTLMESNNSIWRVHGTSHAGPTTVSMTHEPLADLGADVKDDGYYNTLSVASNPTQLWTFNVYAATMDATTNHIDIAVQIEYTVKYNELISQTQN